MTDEPLEMVEPEDPGAGRRRRTRAVALGVAATLVLVAAGAAVWVVVGLSEFHSETRHPVPAFASLAEVPDRSLTGTVAYFDNTTRCVRVVAAAGSPSTQVYCLAPEQPSQMKVAGKPAGPQLVWRSDGRLEITLFRWVPGKDTKGPPPVRADWQKVVDVTSGAVEDVPAADLPAAPAPVRPTTTNGAGERVWTTFDALTGKGRITLTTPSGTRTLLSVQGPGEYTYGLAPAGWAPGGEWIVTTDTGEGGRILVVTPSSPAEVRALVTNSGGGAGGGTAGPAYAVTSTDLLDGVR